MIFANPTGLWALLGIPAILLIHFLQREAKRIPVSTLFLLAPLDRESAAGRRFDRLRHSLPLWLQLLGVLLLAWLLAEPRRSNARAVQRIVLVLDDSASMGAFLEELGAALRRELPPLASFAAATEYSVLESSPTGATLYRGAEQTELLDSLAAWHPAAGSHSPERALRVGRSLAGSEGVLIFVTDHPGDPLPFGARRLAVGAPIDNVGFAGLRVEEAEGKATWRATLRNYSDRPQTRTWFLASGERRGPTRSLGLAPGSSLTLQGEFPEDADRASLVLEPDRFSRDDRLDFVRPLPKRLLVSLAVAPAAEPLAADLVASLERTAPAGPGDAADLWFTTYDPLAQSEPPAASLVLMNQGQAPRRFLSGPIVAANHPLVAELDWQGLIARSTPSMPRREGDLALLWQGDRPLLLLRDGAGRRQLLVNFDVLHSNAPRLPAFVVLVHRFAAWIREGKIAAELRNLELGQPLALACHTEADAFPLEIATKGDRSSIPAHQARQLRAPEVPGFFRVSQGGALLLDASAHFADVREADFSKAGSVSEIAPLRESVLEQQTAGDPAWFVWVLAFAVSLLLCWHLLGRRTGAETAA